MSKIIYFNSHFDSLFRSCLGAHVPLHLQIKTVGIAQQESAIWRNFSSGKELTSRIHEWRYIDIGYTVKADRIIILGRQQKQMLLQGRLFVTRGVHRPLNQ